MAERVRAGPFREDLFHRLNKVVIDLRRSASGSRTSPCSSAISSRAPTGAFRKSVRGVSREVQKLFLKYGWPGNVRELANVLESAAMLCKKDFIDVANLPKYLRDYIPPAGRARLRRPGPPVLARATWRRTTSPIS
ncbi:MAG: hypothetical protein M0C28_00820 [Candidatus Moduliflexus flocculans]|nr:hypothetical protein [Candidatus Moduliflexus flocculans]